MNYANSELQEKQQNGLLAAMFGDSRFKGLDSVCMKYVHIFRYRLLFILSALVITVFSINVANAYAAEVERFDASVNGDNSVEVVISELGEGQYKATIEGSGDMKDYSSRGEVPWLQDNNYRKKIVSVEVNSGITRVGSRAFMDTNGNSVVSSITLPDGLQSIGTQAFQYNLEENVSIPKSVTIIESGAFTVNQNKSNLTVTMLGNNTIVEQKSATNGPGKTVVAFEDSKTVERWQETINGRQNQTSLNTIASYIYENENEAVTKYIAPGTDIKLPNSVKTIGEGTFADCSDLVSVNLNNVKTVNANAFQNCVNLEKIIIPSTVETIHNSAFANCSQVVIYGNNGSVAKSFAEDNDFDFEVLKPYRKSDDSSFEKELPTGVKDIVDLSSMFAVDYYSELKYQVSIAESDYVDIDGDSYEFNADEAGEYTLVFRAVDSFGEPSTDVYTAKYSVVNNTAPQLKQDEIQITALFYERPEINMSDVFTDSEGDTLTYRYVDANAIPEGRDINWDYIWNGGDANTFDLYDGKFVVYQSWTQYPRTIGKEQQFYVRAYDKWDVPSEDYLTIKVTVHSVCITVNKGQGVHSLEGISFKFSRDEADDIVQPAYIDENKYYFDLDYISNATGSYGGGYDYTYEVALDGCEDVTGLYTTKNDNGETQNGPHTIEVTLSNPEQAATDKQSVADVKNLIDNLGEVTLDSEDAINAAQKAYDDLYDELKPQVTNYNALLQARLTLADLKLEAAKKDLEEAEKAKEKADQDKKDAEAKIQTAKNEVKQAKAELNGVKEELAAMKLTVKGLKVTSKKKKFTVKWKKNAKASGYTVQYKLSGAKKFKTLKTLTKTKVVSKKLKKGKKYEFRVATYKKVNGKKVFGKWTEVKIVKCK